MHISGKQFVFAVGIIILFFVGVRYYTSTVVANKLENTSLALEASIAEQEVVLATIADLTKQNEADEITERIVVDCNPAKRQRFEALLDKLSLNINQSELSELDVLFFDCGSFFADRKSVMAARLMREVVVYKDYISLRNKVLNSEYGTERVVLWQRIADNELALAQNFTNLVELQRDIIMTLLAGKSRESIEINSTLTKVAEIKNNMTVQIQQIENTRKELLSI